MSVSTQLVWLFVLAAPVACVAWTVTHEDVFADLRRFCVNRSRHGRQWLERKFFYLFTCEYCFSHYIALGGVLLIDLRLLVPGWRGTLLAWFATVWVANIYMSLFARLRLDIKRERVEITQEEHVAAKLADEDEEQGSGTKGQGSGLRGLGSKPSRIRDQAVRDQTVTHQAQRSRIGQRAKSGP